MFCTNCGKELSNEFEPCSNCGATPEIPEESNNKIQLHKDVKNDTQNSSKHTKPMSTVSFFFTQVLFLVPFINLFFILFWSFKKDINKNLKAYARSKLIWVGIFSVIIIFIILTMAFMQCSISFNSFLRLLKNYLNSTV